MEGVTSGATERVIEQACRSDAIAPAADKASPPSAHPSEHRQPCLAEPVLLPALPSTSWDHLWRRLIGPLHPDALRPEEDDAISFEAARQQAWDEGWPKLSWHGCAHPTRRIRQGR